MNRTERRRQAKRKQYRATAPMLVSRFVHNTEMELRERMAVTAFSGGFANTQHYDVLVEMMNLLMIAGSRDKSRDYIKQYAEKIIEPALNSIKTRYLKTGKLGVNGEELIALREMVDKNKDFWLRQTTDFHNACVDELNAFYADLDKGNGVAA